MRGCFIWGFCCFSSGCSIALSSSLNGCLNAPASCMCHSKARCLYLWPWVQRLSGLPVPGRRPRWVGRWPYSGDPLHPASQGPAPEAPWWSPVSGALAAASSEQACSGTGRVNTERQQSWFLSMFPFKAWWTYVSSSKVAHDEWPKQNLFIFPWKYQWLVIIVRI